MPRYLNGPDNAIGWCDWTWNPVTGCRHNCTFGPAQTPCYARTQSARFGLSFEPAFHPERLSAPSRLAAGTDRPWRIFVCSMADLLGQWVPGEWIEAVIDVATKCPQHVFQFLTKSPLRYREFEWPQNCWLGTTVTGAKHERWGGRIVDLLEGPASVHWISAEPLGGPLELGPWLDPGNPHQPARIDWLVLGGMTGEGAVQPDEAWVESIESDCAAHGVPVYHKSNLVCRRGDRRRTEWPGVE
jgi:protein gp37